MPGHRDTSGGAGTDMLRIVVMWESGGSCEVAFLWFFDRFLGRDGCDGLAGGGFGAFEKSLGHQERLADVGVRGDVEFDGGAAEGEDVLLDGADAVEAPVVFGDGVGEERFFFAFGCEFVDGRRGLPRA